MFLNGFLLIKVTVLIAKFIVIDSFNFEEKYPLIARGESGSYFGYSLAVQELGGEKRLFVGAPRDKQLSNTGALYKCGKSGINLNCNRVNVITDGSTADQWLGASVSSRNGTTMVCSPRFGERVTGNCYYSRGNLPFESYAPWTEGFCQLGFSSALSSDGNRFYTGGPSCTKNAGRLVASTGPTTVRDDVERLMGDINFYSYAISTGKIWGQTEGLVVSTGFHQNSNFAGKVELLDSYDKLTNATKRGSLEGHQPGEHFGASLAVFDIDNDGRDDIIVGAPHHTIYTNSEIKFDVGAVYVYYQTSKGLYEKENSLNITGRFSGGQFGFAVANLGDSNGDGYNDLAVGAPYEGGGVVYIYHGSHSKNLRKRPGQILKGSSYISSIRSFGFSFISGGSDFDGNGYGDLTVGAYESDIVVHIPARPVVRMTNKLTFSPNSITLEKKECTAKIGGSNVQVTCSKLQYCLNYDGKGVPGNINTNVTIILDVQQPKAQRLLFIKTNEHIMTQIVGLSVKTELCQEEYVYVRPDIRDKLTSIDAQIVPKLVVTDASLSPILDIYDGNGRVTKSLPIFRDCGSDDICIPDLQMTVTTNAGTYIQGSGDRWTVDVTIYNAEEDAFGAEFYLDLPPELSYINTDKDFTDSSVLCFPPDEKNGPFLRCEIGNPLPSKKTVRLRVIVEPKPGDANFVSFLAQTKSTISELDSTMADNKKLLSLTFTAETKLALGSWTRPEELTVNITALQLNETKALPEYTQFCEVRNEGPSDIIGAKFRIVFPTHTPEGYAINELKAQPTIQTGAATCDTVPLTAKPNKKPIYINCVVNRITGGQRVVIKLIAQLTSEAFLEQLNTDTFALTSVITANITGLPFDQDVSKIPMASTEVVLVVKKIAKQQNLLKATPWWIPVVSAIVATAIVAGVAGILHHYGFFKRNRPLEMTATLETMPESQPLQSMNQNSNRPTSEVDRRVSEDSP